VKVAVSLKNSQTNTSYSRFLLNPKSLDLSDNHITGELIFNFGYTSGVAA
jgi:hypothetical protein